MLHHDHVYTPRQPRHRQAARKRPGTHECERSPVGPLELAAGHGFLGCAEAAADVAAHLHEDDALWRSRIHGHQVDLVAADHRVRRQYKPALRPQVAGGDGPRPGPRTAVALCAWYLRSRRHPRPGRSTAAYVAPNPALSSPDRSRSGSRFRGFPCHVDGDGDEAIVGRLGDLEAAFSGRAALPRQQVEHQLVALEDGADARVGAPVVRRQAELAQAGDVVARGVARRCAPSRSPGSAHARRAMSRSRVTLAMTDAQAMA